MDNTTRARINEVIALYYDGELTASEAMILIAYAINMER